MKGLYSWYPIMTRRKRGDEMVSKHSKFRSRLSELAKRLLLLACTLLLLASALEVGTRLFTSITPPLLEKDPVIGKRYRKSYQATVYVPEANRMIELRFNRHGFRGPDRPMEKPAGVRRVAVLGDSFVASVGVDEEDTMVARVERMLNSSHPDAEWEVMNFGVSGSGLGQELNLYRKLVREFDPDVVLGAFFVGNDLADNCNRLSRNNRIYFDFDQAGVYRQLPYSASQAGASQFFNRCSRFYVWQKYAVKRARDSARETLSVIPPGAWIYCKEAPEDVKYAWRLTDAAIETLHRETTQAGSLFAMVLLPAAEQVYADRWSVLASTDPQREASFDWDYPEKRMREICGNQGVPLVTMTKEFRSAAPATSSLVKDQWLFHQGMGHFNEAGNKVAANAVYDFLRRPDVQVAIRDPSTTIRR